MLLALLRSLRVVALNATWQRPLTWLSVKAHNIKLHQGPTGFLGSVGALLDQGLRRFMGTDPVPEDRPVGGSLPRAKSAQVSR